jgi:hypothetical protein
MHANANGKTPYSEEGMGRKEEVPGSSEIKNC